MLEAHFFVHDLETSSAFHLGLQISPTGVGSSTGDEVEDDDEDDDDELLKDSAALDELGEEVAVSDSDASAVTASKAGERRVRNLIFTFKLSKFCSKEKERERNGELPSRQSLGQYRAI